MLKLRPTLRIAVAAAFFGLVSASAQTLPIPVAPPPAPAQPIQAAPPPVPAATPQINTAEIESRANQEVGVDIQGTIKGWQDALNKIDEGLRGQGLKYAELNGFRERLERVRGTVKDFWDRIQPRLDTVKAQMETLGAPPAAGQPPEPEQSMLHRAELNYYLGILSAAQKEVDGGFFRVEQLINTIQDIRRKNFTTNLFQPVLNIFTVETWQRIPGDIENASGRIGGLLIDWWDGVKDKDEAFRLLIEAGLLAAALQVFSLWGVRRLREWHDTEEPPFWKRASSAAGVILLRAMPGILPTVFLYSALGEAQPLPEKIDWLFYTASRSTIIILAVHALITTVFAPTALHWRIIPSSDRAARRICILVVSLAAVYGITQLIYVAVRLVAAPFTLTVAVSLPTSLIFAGIIIAILRTPLQTVHEEGMPSLTWLKALRLPVWLIAIAIVITALSGYLALSRFMAQQLVVTGSILAIVYLLLLWVDGFTQSMSDDEALVGRWLKTQGGLEKRSREQLAVPLGLALKFSVLLISVPLIMLQWGYVWPDILDFYRQVFFGFRIGSTQISLAALIASVMVFVLGYLGARLFQSWLDTQILKPAGISGGVRDSIRTSVGYIGVFIAMLAAFSYAGFALSNLAIVAGAFSVGIGFGLQSVVSNFVSGLILLAERPIKVGDLVVVGGEEGYVRKISVRSTEIETFDRANVLIPNSFFITEKVKNWTLRNNTGRVAISIGVSYGCNPRQVKATLLRVAKDHLNVMTTPEPFVDFEDFGEDALHFKLYAFIYDLNKSISTRTDLRISILEAFNESGIVIPSRQTDVTIREIDWLREAVAQYTAGTASGIMPGNGRRVLPGAAE